MNRILGTAIFGGKDLQAFPQYYVPYPGQARNALKRARPVDAVLERDDAAVRRYLESAGRTPASVRFLPLRAPGKDGVVLLDALTGAPLEVLLVDPW